MFTLTVIIQIFKFINIYIYIILNFEGALYIFNINNTIHLMHIENIIKSNINKAVYNFTIKKIYLNIENQYKTILYPNFYIRIDSIIEQINNKFLPIQYTIENTKCFDTDNGKNTLKPKKIYYNKSNNSNSIYSKILNVDIISNNYIKNHKILKRIKKIIKC